jgi:RNA polymerase sigma factor (sigma-70 family)
MSTKLAFSQDIFRSQEAAFIEHYNWLIRWALQLTHQDRERAEDLVQQVFVDFANAHTDLSAVQNVQAYLYTTLRNIHASQVRLAARSNNQTHSIVDYGVAEVALEATDPYTLFHTQDQLRRVCRYACMRKQSARAGSVLILRYFHGYHVSEIGQILRSSCEAVRRHLTLARNEARLFLEDPRALKYIDHSPPSGAVAATNCVCSADRFLVELRTAIFDSCEGECLDPESINSFYADNLIQTAGNAILAHLVSCPVCLDEVNTRLGLPRLAERHPADTLGPNNDWRDGTRGPRDPGGSGSAIPSRRRGTSGEPKISGAFLMQCRRRATELFEHYPRELCVSVNGHVLGSQSVSSHVSRLRVDVTIAEDADFVEVLSEERVRLLLMPIQAPPDGEPVQTRVVQLSEGRSVEVIFRYGHPWPMVEVVYEEPDFVHDAQPVLPAYEVRATETVAVARRLFRGLNWLGSFWLRPGFVTAIVSLILIGILLTFRLDNTPPVTAANLLERASIAESVPLTPDVALHRVVELEQRRQSDGAVVGKNRIEVWRDQARDLSVRRVYDDKGQLTAGVWIESNHASNGKPLRRVYRRGSGQRIETGAPDPQKALREAELWQLDPSAIVYLAFLDRPQAARVNETADSYVISYDAEGSRSDGLVRAALTLRKSDLHAIEQTLVINDGRETYEYRFVETVFDRPPLRLVSPHVFKPDAELVSKVHTASRFAKRELLPATATAVTVVPAELEVNVAYALDQFRTRFGDQLSLTKTPAGLLEVRGVVDDEATRQEILRALSVVVDDRAAIRIQIDTTAELLTRKQPQPERVIVREFASAEQSIPVHAELIAFFAAHEGAGQSDQYREQLVRDFAAQVIGRSRRAVAHSLELKQLASRFNATQLNEFTPSTRAKWINLVRNHAEALRRELSTLDGELQRTLFANERRPSPAEGVDISTNATLLVAIDRLHQLVLAVDQAVRSSFAASSDASQAEGVKSVRFHSDLAASVRLAGEIRQAVATQ